MLLSELNELRKEDVVAELSKCCSSSSWAHQLAHAIPFNDKDDLLKKSDDIWFNGCNVLDWLEAFEGHPKIGDVNSLKKKYANTKEWAGNEQSGMNEADRATIQALSEGNAAYEKKFGYIFIVCASGKSAAEMLEILNARLPNDPFTELKIAIGEQSKITNLRLEKLLT